MLNNQNLIFVFSTNVYTIACKWGNLIGSNLTEKFALINPPFCGDNFLIDTIGARILCLLFLWLRYTLSVNIE